MPKKQKERRGMGCLGRARLVSANLAELKLAPETGGERRCGYLALVLVLLAAVVISGCGLTGASSPKSTSNPQLQFTTTALPSGQVGVAYQAALAATGGVTPYSWSLVSGSLPPGLTLAALSGVISGTPTQAGQFSFTVQVRDSSSSPQIATQAFTVTISSSGPGPLTITTSSLPSGTQNTAYSVALAASGGTQPYSWSVTLGALPAGLSLSSATGVISGTPTVVGVSSFTVQVNDAAGQVASRAFTLTIASSGGPANIFASGFETAADRACPPTLDGQTCSDNTGTWFVVSSQGPPTVSYLNDGGAHSGSWYAASNVGGVNNGATMWVPRFFNNPWPLYVKEWLKFPSGWQWYGEDKILILESSAPRVIVTIEPNPSPPSATGRIQMIGGSLSQFLFYDQGGTEPLINADGLWHSFQVFIDGPNCHWELWFDGSVFINQTQPALCGSSPVVEFKFGAYQNPNIPTGPNTTFYLDDLGISTTYIGTSSTPLFSDGFESGDWSAWGGGPANGLSVTTAQAASGTHSAVAAHVAGTASTGWAETYFGDLLNQAPQQTDVYQEFDSYWDSNAQVVPSAGGTKLSILICNQDWTNTYPQPLSFSPYYLTTYVDSNFLIHGILHRKTVTPDVWQDFPQNVGTPVPLTLGQWQHVRVRTRLNTPGASDGVLEMWLNGTLIMLYTNVNFRDSYTMRGWNQFEITGYDNAAPTRSWNQYWDNVRVYKPEP